MDSFFFTAAAVASDKRFLLGGSGWEDKPALGRLDHVNYAGHVYTRDHNAFCCSPTAVLNIARDSMARYGFSPATRVFEAAGAGACLVTDHWPGIDQFLQPGKEVLVVNDGQELAQLVRRLTPSQAQAIGQAARRRVLRDHTYVRRGHAVTFLERDTPWYAQARDMASPPAEVFGCVHLYADLAELAQRHHAAVAEADLVIVGSFVPKAARWEPG